MITNGVDPAALFVTSASQSGQMENLAKLALSRGLDHFDKKEFDQAIREFKRSVGLAPVSTNAVSAYGLMAQAFTQQNDSESAVNAYRQALRIDPNRADMRLSIGNIYHFEGRYAESIAEYAEAVRIDPSATNRYSLAQGYLANGQYDEAEYQFAKVRELAPNQPQGDYGLGLVYEKKGLTEEALKAFDRAVSIKRDYWDAYGEMGFVLADAGRLEEASKISADLADKNETLSAVLDRYILSRTPAEMVFADSDNFFPTMFGRGTSVFLLGADLLQADGAQTFSMEFTFSKSMDAASVENILNWRIGRAPNTEPGGGYNFGLGIPDTEVDLPDYPLAVNYDEATQTAKVWFRIRQNSTADGTIDPGHIQFTFLGKDADGLSMSSRADQYSGFSGFA